MPETITANTNKGEQSALPDMDLINIIEGMTPDQRIQEKRRLLAEISDREELCNLIDRVYDAEGIDVEIIY